MSGKKETEGKLPFHLLSGPALEKITQVLEFGMKKYDERNWEDGITYDKLFQAMQRHAWKWWSGHTNDAESGLNHMAHVACLAMFILHFESKKSPTTAGLDNRPVDHRTGMDNGSPEMKSYRNTDGGIDE